MHWNKTNNTRLRKGCSKIFHWMFTFKHFDVRHCTQRCAAAIYVLFHLWFLNFTGSVLIWGLREGSWGIWMNLGAIISINNQVLSRTCVHFKSPFDAFVLWRTGLFFSFTFQCQIRLSRRLREVNKHLFQGILCRLTSFKDYSAKLHACRYPLLLVMSSAGFAVTTTSGRITRVHSGDWWFTNP